MRYELKDGKSSKFWEIEVKDTSYVVRYGRIGTQGRSSTRRFDTAADARAAADKITASKLKKGYQPVTEASAQKPVYARNPELEALLRENPEDLETLQVYADYLQTHDDPYGELVALGIACEQEPRGSSLRRRFDKILEANKQHWFGQAAPWIPERRGSETLVLEWKYGCVRKARVGYDYEEECPDTDVLLADLLRSPACRFLEDLTIEVTEGVKSGAVHFSFCVDELVHTEQPPPLRRLQIGDCYPPQADLSWCCVGDCSEVFSAFPQLEYLKTLGREVEFGRIRHQKLKTLLIESGGLPASAVKSVANADLPALESLEVWFGSPDYGAEGNAGMLEPLFAGKALPELKELGLMNSDFTDDMVTALVKAPILQQLRILDLSMGTMSDVGAAVMLENTRPFSHLEKIELDQNFISDEMAAELRKAFAHRVSVSSQKDAYDWDDEPHYYVSASE